MPQTAGPKHEAPKVSVSEPNGELFSALSESYAPNEQRGLRSGREVKYCEWCGQRVYTIFKGTRIDYEHPDSDDRHKCSTLLPTQIRENNFQRELTEARYWKKFRALKPLNAPGTLYLSGKDRNEIVGIRTSSQIDLEKPVYFARQHGLLRFFDIEGRAVISSTEVEVSEFGHSLSFHTEADRLALPEVHTVSLFAISSNLCSEISTGRATEKGNQIPLRPNEYFNVAETDHLIAIAKNQHGKTIGRSRLERMLVRKKKYGFKLAPISET
jgi:hypothetical protein